MAKPLLISPAESELLSASAGRYLRRALQSLLGDSEAMIPEDCFPGPREVHDIRVNMKRARAILKLLRASPDAHYYKRENAALRDISALFSHSREADVLKKTLKSLGKRYPDIFHSVTIAWFSEVSKQFIPPPESRAVRLSLAAEAGERLRRAWYRVGFLNLRRIDRVVLLDGLWNSFLRAEGEFRIAVRNKSPEAIHEFRKRVKDLLYQVRFFSDYNPGHFEKMHADLDALGSALGKCNDLSVASRIAEANRHSRSGVEIVSLLKVIEDERIELFASALPRAEKIFSSFYSVSQNAL
ncbi:MAG: CHAD domain-containing protein [Bacteroidales bacterium]